MLLYLNFYNHSSVNLILVGEKISDGEIKNKNDVSVIIFITFAK